ncbi:glycosyl transferase, partial [Staphylococcus chromogenes]
MFELNFDELTKDDLIKVNNQKIKLVVDNLDFYILLHLKEN